MSFIETIRHNCEVTKQRLNDEKIAETLEIQKFNERVIQLFKDQIINHSLTQGINFVYIYLYARSSGSYVDIENLLFEYNKKVKYLKLDLKDITDYVEKCLIQEGFQIIYDDYNKCIKVSW